MDTTQIIRTVRLTEKSNLHSELNNQYVFEVLPSANKIQIKHAVEALFGKKVVAVNTSNYSGKARRKRTVSAGRAASWKKAVVTLAKGDPIELA